MEQNNKIIETIVDEMPFFIKQELFLEFKNPKGDMPKRLEIYYETSKSFTYEEFLHVLKTYFKRDVRSFREVITKSFSWNESIRNYIFWYEVANNKKTFLIQFNHVKGTRGFYSNIFDFKEKLEIFMKENNLQEIDEKDLTYKIK